MHPWRRVIKPSVSEKDQPCARVGRTTLAIASCTAGCSRNPARLSSFSCVAISGLPSSARAGSSQGQRCREGARVVLIFTGVRLLLPIVPKWIENKRRGYVCHVMRAFHGRRGGALVDGVPLPMQKEGQKGSSKHIATESTSPAPRCSNQMYVGPKSGGRGDGLHHVLERRSRDFSSRRRPCYWVQEGVLRRGRTPRCCIGVDQSHREAIIQLRSPPRRTSSEWTGSCPLDMGQMGETVLEVNQPRVLLWLALGRGSW
jgi:hypothetical protein